MALTEDQKNQLETIAHQSGATIEEVAQVGLQAWLDHEREREELLSMAKYLLKKHAELYERLA